MALLSVSRTDLATVARLARCGPVLVAAAATGVYQVLFFHAVPSIGAGRATAVALGVAPVATVLYSRLWLGEGIVAVP